MLERCAKVHLFLFVYKELPERNKGRPFGTALYAVLLGKV